MDSCEYFSSLALIAAGILGRTEHADDIVQQAITIAIEKNETFASRDDFVAWLVGVVKHCALNHRRKVMRRKTSPADPTKLQSIETAGQVDSPVDCQSGELRALQKSFDDQVTHALMALSTDARCCLLLRTVNGLSYREISTMLGIPPGTAMNHVHRGKARLRQMLSPVVSHQADGDRHE